MYTCSELSTERFISCRWVGYTRGIYSRIENSKEKKITKVEMTMGVSRWYSELAVS